MTDSERLLKVIEFIGLSPNSFAKEIGYNRPDLIYRVLGEKNGISKRLASNISIKYQNISYSFLLSGTGEMLLNTEPEAKKLIPPDNMRTVQEPVELYLCPECVNKKRVIDAQAGTIAAKEETIASLKEQIKLLEFNLGKFRRNGSE